MHRLLQLNVTANWGSTGKIAEGIGLAAMAHGWKSAIAYGRYMNPSQSQLIKVGNEADVYVHYARARFCDGEGLGSKRATRKLISEIEAIAPDIIQLHNIHDHWLNYPLLFEYLGAVDVPVVWTFHDCWAFTGGCPHFENISCYGWRDRECREKCPLKHSHAARNLQLRHKVVNSIGSRLHIVTVSQWLANYVNQSFVNEAGASVQVINNGIDVMSTFKIRDVDKRRLILGVSNVWPVYKGLADFIELRKVLPDDVDIVLVGLSQKQIDTLPYGIKGLRRTSSPTELAELYSQASVFVNPTRNDSFPTVNLEALACGTPVVTYRTGGSPEAIDENTGLVVEKGDVNGLAHAVQYVLDNPERFSRETCRNRAVENFNKDTQFDKYISLYDRILRK